MGSRGRRSCTQVESLNGNSVIGERAQRGAAADAGSGSNSSAETHTVPPSTTGFAHDLSLIPLHSAPLIQPKLKVNTSGDSYEQEADRVSERVIRAPEAAPGSTIHRAASCHGCDGRQDAREFLQTKAARADDSAGEVAPPIVHEVLSSPGWPLDSAARGFMEARFGLDLS